MTPDEVAASDERAKVWEKLEAERVCLRDACVAAHGTHDWELELEHPDADEDPGGSVDLYCTRCPTGIDDVFVDGHELICCDVDGIEDLVSDGRHRSPVPLVVPVDVVFHNLSGWNLDYGYEYDFELLISQRGPTRPMEESE